MGGAVSAASLYQPFNLKLDAGNLLYVADANNNRVLRFPVNSTVAERVYGQSSFLGGSTNGGSGVSAGTLNLPHSVAFDGSGRLYTADTDNNRVLVFQ
jgi:sugar lactone lactonase YvrE